MNLSIAELKGIIDPLDYEGDHYNLGYELIEDEEDLILQKNSSQIDRVGGFLLRLQSLDSDSEVKIEIDTFTVGWKRVRWIILLGLFFVLIGFLEGEMSVINAALAYIIFIVGLSFFIGKRLIAMAEHNTEVNFDYMIKKSKKEKGQ